VVNLPKRFLGGRAGEYDLVSPERLREVELVLLQVDDCDVARAAGVDELKHQEADRPGAVDQCVRSDRQSKALQAVDDARDRLDEGGGLVVEVADRERHRAPRSRVGLERRPLQAVPLAVARPRFT
jgi:hypothetical protein